MALRHIGLQDYEEISALVRESAEMHRPWMPGQAITSYEIFESYLTRFEQPINEGFVICLRDTGAIVGRVNVNNIVRERIRAEPWVMPPMLPRLVAAI